MNFTVKEPMPPVWMMHPHISRYSIGWRMGYGEWYKNDFWNWFDSLTDSGKELYEKMFPAPKLWRGIYNENCDPEDFECYRYKTVQLWNRNGECRYNRKKLEDEYGAGKRDEFVFFWKPRDGAVNESCLGQWQPSAFTVDTDEYSCAEQYMMAEKARLFDDGEMRALIMKSRDPKEMKALGKKVKNFDQAIWDRVKYSIVLNGNYYKFSQNEDIRNYLLSTGNKILVEASPLDIVWGIGLGSENEKACNPNTWRGKNLLGFALMEVRDEIENVYKNYDRVNWKEILKKYSE
ncbi:MAG: NADAR family protein [Prevotellaceae bacterium]|nr:NADAR family protein [Prevotellaceae bacterium]